ncbi:MAG: hypothetical protein ABIP17_16955 [Ilumatobacteraceae bacterium]
MLYAAPTMVLSVLFLCVVTMAGLGITWSTGIEMVLEERIGVGVVFGVMATTITAFLTGWVAGFDATSVSVAAALVSLGSVHGWLTGSASVGSELRDLGRRIKQPWRSRGGARPMLLVAAISAALTVRILAAGYRTSPDGALVAGHLSTYGDWNAHLAYAGSFSDGANYPPTSPLASGSRLAYHVMVDVFGACASVLGASPTSALSLTSGLLAFAFPFVFLFGARRLCGSETTSLVAYFLFTLSGGLGFLAVFGDVREHGARALLHPVRAYARMTDDGIWFDNPVMSYLYAQRPGLIGIPVVLIAVGVAFDQRNSTSSRPWLVIGILIGASASFSAYGCAMALGLAGWTAFRARRGRLALFVPAFALALPVLFALRPETSHVRWFVGWMAPGADVPWVWFWIINTAALIPLGLTALVRADSLPTGSDLWFAFPVWSTFVMMNLVAVQPWEWNNSHYLVVWLLMLCFPAAGLLVMMARSASIIARAGAVVIAVASMASGTIDVWAATGAGTFAGQLATGDGVEAATWARTNTASDAIFAVAPTINQPFVSVGARRVVSGYPGWTFDLGVADWLQRSQDANEMLRAGPTTAFLVEQYDVEYVVIGDDERRLPDGADESYWNAAARIVFENSTYRIYRVDG